MPGYSCPIKERMLYSSCKNPLTDTITNLGIDIIKKVSIPMHLKGVFINYKHKKNKERAVKCLNN